MKHVNRWDISRKLICYFLELKCLPMHFVITVALCNKTIAFCNKTPDEFCNKPLRDSEWEVDNCPLSRKQPSEQIFA